MQRGGFCLNYPLAGLLCLKFLDMKFPNGFVDCRHAAQLPAQTIRAASVLLIQDQLGDQFGYFAGLYVVQSLAHFGLREVQKAWPDVPPQHLLSLVFSCMKLMRRSKNLRQVDECKDIIGYE
jgi:hypothetical protein